VSTSGTYSFTVTRDQIIRQAMLNIGKLDETEAPTASEISDCSFVLNMLVKQWQGKADFAPGLKVWTRKLGYLFLSGSTGKYTVGPGATGWTNSFASTTTTATAASGASAVVVSSATGIANGYNIGIELDSGALQWTTASSVVGSTVNLAATLNAQASKGSQIFAYATAAQQPLYIETATLRDQNNSDTPIRLIRDVKDYDILPNKADPTNLSDPTAIYYENQLTNSNLYTDCGAAQDVTKYLVLRYMEPIQDLNSPTDNFEYPQEWYLALAWGLSSEISPMFHAAWTPKMEENFKRSLAVAQKKDAEVSSLYFVPGED
jgi:hypothetical protein